MKAIVQTGERSVELQERDKPRPAADEVLLEVHTAGICGSDAHAYLYEDGYKWIPIPRVMGHEYSGRVVEVGEGVEQFEPGEKVVEEPIHHCGHCFQCKNGQENICQNFSITGMHRDGAYRQYITVGERHLHRVPEAVPLSHAAITEPASIAARTVLTRSDVTPGDEVLVEGPGPIGVLTALIADSIGASVLVSGLEQDRGYRLPLLEELGLDTIDVSEASLEAAAESRTNGRGFDVVFDATGHHSGVEIGTDHVRKGGQVVVVGIPAAPSEVNMTPLVRGEIDVVTSYGSSWTNFEQALRLMENGTIDAETFIDDSYDVERPDEAFEAFLNSETCKPVFRFGGS